LKFKYILILFCLISIISAKEEPWMKLKDNQFDIKMIDTNMKESDDLIFCKTYELFPFTHLSFDS